MRPRAKRKSKAEVTNEDISNGHDDRETISATRQDKGKGKATDLGSESPLNDTGIGEDGDGGRGKRVRKKRRLSASGEVDPNDLDDEGTMLMKPPTSRRVPKPSIPLNGPPDPSPTADDKAYLTRVEANSKLPVLHPSRGPCPVWSNTRQALRAATEYFRQPIKTAGASVEIGNGKIARGVILEGKPTSSKTYWNLQDPTVIMTSM